MNAADSPRRGLHGVTIATDQTTSQPFTVVRKFPGCVDYPHLTALGPQPGSRPSSSHGTELAWRPGRDGQIGIF